MKTEFGLAVQEHREKRSLKLFEMAADMDVSPTYLSVAESGKKPASENLVNKIIQYFDLSEREAEALKLAAAVSRSTLSISLTNVDNETRLFLAVLAKKVEAGDINESNVEDVFQSLVTSTRP